MSSENPSVIVVASHVKILRYILILTGAFAIGVRIVIDTSNGKFPLWTWRYFTLQSNVLILSWTILAVLWEGKPQYHRLTGFYKGAFTSYITITWLVFMVLLEGEFTLSGIDDWTSLFNHYLNPWMFILDFFLSEKTQLQWKWPFVWLIYPYLYLAFALIWGFVTDEYLYFFVDVPSQGVSGVVIWIALLTLLFLIFGSLYTFLNRKYLADTSEN